MKTQSNGWRVTEREILSQIRPDNYVSYLPSVIEKWCKSVIYDSSSSEAMKIMCGDLYFREFINRKTKLNPTHRFWIATDKFNPEQLTLLRDTKSESEHHDYFVMANGYEIRYSLTRDEYNLIKNVLTDLKIGNYIREV